MAIHNYIKQKCNVDDAFQTAEDERYIPSVDSEFGSSSNTNNEENNMEEQNDTYWMGLRDMIANEIGMDIGHCHLDGNADAVEFCPHESFQNVLAACTYTLQEGDQPGRTGSISLFDVDANLSRLSLIHRVQTAGIFDIKWSPIGGIVGPLLAQADADGYVRVHKLESCLDESQVPGNSLLEISDEHVSSSMCLCIDWNPSATSLAVGLSDGTVSIISFLESQLSISRDWKAHDFEVWAASYDIHQPQLVYTGSDDCKFSCWDLRDDPSNIAFQNRKVHTMGICCITKSPNDPYTILTGSYDEHLRVWDVRSTAKPLSKLKATKLKWLKPITNMAPWHMEQIGKEVV
ncbi:diphthine methyltransferase-like [Solanum pennellii]|uniref:methylated diphthine methylhydrolase n=1 Tax=Solanum pennellii TaxID=28526 RepID=A0ABM1GSJ9_SOLPN|nr:diphthine methyltransferase-like [Solanum pennellii]